MSAATERYTPPANGFRTFLIVWVTQSISVFGSALTLFALNIWMVTDLYPRPEQKPELALAISATSLAFALPTVFLAPIAGAWADRHDRKRTMLVMDFANGLVSLTLMILVISNLLQLWSLVVLELVAASLGAFHGSAFDTSYAMLVSEAQLPRANGMMQTIWSLSGVLSPGVAAAIISIPKLVTGESPLAHIPGASLAMGVDAVTFFAASATLLFLFIPSPRRAELSAGQPRVSILADVKEGAVYIWRRRPLVWLLGTFAVANLTGGVLGVFFPLMIKFNLAPSWGGLGFSLETALAFLGTASSLGGVIGGVIISAWGGLKKRRVYGVVVALLIGALAAAGFGLSTVFYVSVGLIALAEMTIPFANAHSQAIWQTQTPHELQGRVFAVRRVIAQFTWPFSTALAGLLGGLFNPGLVLAGMNVLMALFLVYQLFNPVMLRVEDKEYLEAMALRVAQKQNPSTKTDSTPSIGG
jgi:DHA3 family macrolide efflux protein-like MFS transporter